jgi:protein arginine N-methyltransferase 2
MMSNEPEPTVASWRKSIISNESFQTNTLTDQFKIDLRDAIDADDHSRSLLMQACAAGNADAVEFLLIDCDAQRQWNALDANGLAAADLIPPAHPARDQIEQLLLNAACRTELLLQVVFANAQEQDENSDDSSSSRAPPFLATQLRYEPGADGVRLMTDSNDAVMMTWETDIMRMHVERFVAHGCKTVLNVGFGLGIIDGLLEELAADQLVEHVIIEAHPDVLRHMRAHGWMARARVTVLEGTWQSQMPLLIERGATFDCVFFDTFETLDDMRDFHAHLVPTLAAPAGLYSFFNGLCGTNRFLHKVACALAEMQLQDCGFQVFYEPIQVPQLPAEIFTGCKRQYFSLTTYNLPHVTFQ